MLVFRSIIDEGQQLGGAEALHEAVQQRLRVAVDPVEVLEDQQQRLCLAFPDEQSLDDLDGSLPTLGRVERLPPGIVHRHVEEGEQRRVQRFEPRIEPGDPADDLRPDLLGIVPIIDLEVALE